MFVEAWKQMRGAADAGHERRRHPYVGGERCPLCENTQESPP